MTLIHSFMLHLLPAPCPAGSSMAAEWAAMFESYDAFAAAHPQGFYLTTFEALTAPSSRMQALVDMMHALGVPPHTPHTTQVTEAPFDAASSVCAAAEGQERRGCGAADSRAAATTSSSLAAAAAAAAPVPDMRGYDADRLACAFQLARHPSIYRPKDPAGIDAAFVWGSNSQLVCDVWKVVGARAAAHGYTSPYGGAHCPIEQ